MSSIAEARLVARARSWDRLGIVAWSIVAIVTVMRLVAAWSVPLIGDEWAFIAMLRTEGRRAASEFLDANGKDLYVGEFGKSGENYVVRVKDTINSDDELLRHLLN